MARARAYTSPSVERIAERIASAMIEKEMLQAEIDSVIERQSIYVNSRPSTAHGMEGTSTQAAIGFSPTLTDADLEPMPSIPAMPAAAPSFAERLSSEGRPHTAPSQHIRILPREPSAAELSAVSLIHPHKQVRDELDRPLAPPLPLVLRPPLRKKKSFSRVSNWLFPGAEHHRDISLDSVTNRPMPVKGRDGFYQVGIPEAAGRSSVDTVSTASTWETEEEAETGPTTWSPGSSPVMKQDTPGAQSQAIDRSATFGRGNNRYRPQSVGVAF